MKLKGWVLEFLVESKEEFEVEENLRNEGFFPSLFSAEHKGKEERV